MPNWSVDRRAAIAETGAASIKDMGKVMGVIKPRAQGRADMAAVGARIKARSAGALDYRPHGRPHPASFHRRADRPRRYRGDHRRRVPLKKAGREFKACCPFHDEKTPSFWVSPDKQFYHCFGCGAHGTALGFLMDTTGCRFRKPSRIWRATGLTVPHEAAAQRYARAPTIRAAIRAAGEGRRFLSRDSCCATNAHAPTRAARPEPRDHRAFPRSATRAMRGTRC